MLTEVVVCFVLEWQIACVRAVKFPVKIPVIHRCNTPCCLSVHREDPGGTCPILPLPAWPACLSHTLPPDAEEGVCVWGPPVSIHPEQLSLSDLDTHSRHWMTDDWLVLQKDQACDHCRRRRRRRHCCWLTSLSVAEQQLQKNSRLRRVWIDHEPANKSVPV